MSNRDRAVEIMRSFWNDGRYAVGFDEIAKALDDAGVLAPEPASPRPEDVPVGEPWQVEVDGKEAIGFRNDPEDGFCWVVVYQGGGGGKWLYDEDVTLISRLVPETTEQNDEQEFDPAYTYSDRHGDVWHYEEEEWWCYQNHYRTFRANGTPPAEYGPYTRIEEKENHHDQ